MKDFIDKLTELIIETQCEHNIIITEIELNTSYQTHNDGMNTLTRFSPEIKFVSGGNIEKVNNN